MMLRKSHTRRIGSVFFHTSLLGVIMLLICQNIAKADEIPSAAAPASFFLKIAKIPTLPRIGRSGRFEDFFYKAEKHIPRIGRNTYQDQQDTHSGISKRRIDYPPKAEEWSWQNFLLAIEEPKELLRALAGYSRNNGNDIENEIWQRKKRIETEAMTTQAK